MKAVTKFAWAGGIVALGLATGATTYSLWSDPAIAPAGTITAGNLKLEKSGATVWTETSPDVPGPPTPARPSTRPRSWPRRATPSA